MSSAVIHHAPPRRERKSASKVAAFFGGKKKASFTPIVNADFQTACLNIAVSVGRMAWVKSEHSADRESFETRCAIAIIDGVRGTAGMTEGWGSPSVKVLRTDKGFAVQIDAPAAYAVDPFEHYVSIQ